MAHELEVVNGAASMFFVGETPWHGLGTQVDSGITSEEAIRAAGLDWEVGLKSVFMADGTPVPAKATVRLTDNRVLGVVGPKWHPLQNKEAFSWFDPFVATGQATYETAGSLRDGKRVWILASLGLAPSRVVGDDEIRKYVLLSNSHDGTLAVRVGFTPIRVVCANTLAMAVDGNASRLLKIKHSKRMGDTLTQVRDVMNVANQTFEATAEQYRALAATTIDQDTLRKYVTEVFKPAPPARNNILTALGMGDLAAEIESTRSRVVPRILELAETGRGTDLPGVKGTVWGAYNAVTEYLSHERGKDEGRRLDETWFGTGATLNRRALSLAKDLVAA